MACKECGSKSIVIDDVTGNQVCSLCGTIQDFNNFEAQIFRSTGVEGTFMKFGTSGAGTNYNYRESKIYRADKLIDDLVSKLQLTGSSKLGDIKSMIDQITEGEFGDGDWFPVLIGACAYICMRRDGKSLPIAEVAHVIGCDVYEMGRMIGRVVDWLDLREELPQFDIVAAFEKAMNQLASLNRVERDKVDRMQKQGIFLIQCAVNWFLTTGRRPLPVVAAVLAFVAELNGVELKIEDVAREIHAVVATSKVRYRELLKALVKVAQALPWGKDVTVKNIVKNAPFVIQYMETKSMMKPCGKTGDLQDLGIDMKEVLNECTKKDLEYGSNGVANESELHYLKVGDRRSSLGAGVVDTGDLKLSPESLSLLYAEYLKEVKSVGRSVKVQGRILRKGFDLCACRDWWSGKSELSKKLLLEEILDKDVGFDAMPPSFLKSCIAYKNRQDKIHAAKLRIAKIMCPPETILGDCDDMHTSDCVDAGKKRKRKQVNDIDWEDFIIETLLLHQVEEQEIEKGHYKNLLDLHVFNSGIV